MSESDQPIDRRNVEKRVTFWEFELAFDFMRWRKVAAWTSGAAVVASILLLIFKGLSFGLDFTGGTLVEVQFPNAVDPQEIRVELQGAGYENLVVQNFGTPQDILVRVPPDVVGDEATVGDALIAQLRSVHGADVVLRRSEFVGPTVGEELREQGGLAMLAALALVMIYILFRFSGKFALGAVVALAHDVIIVMGAFVLFQWSFDLPSLAAVLAVIGYSLNDTIVISDRIREDFRRLRRETPLEVLNIALNKTFGRTLVTSLTTILVLTVLFIFGGQTVEGFSEALIVGVVVGTYSSIYVAANTLVGLGISREDLLVPVKEGADQEGIEP